MTASLAMLLQSQLDPKLTAEALLAQMRSDWPELDQSLLRLGEVPSEGDGTEAAEADDSPMQCLEYGDHLIALMARRHTGTGGLRRAHHRYRDALQR